VTLFKTTEEKAADRAAKDAEREAARAALQAEREAARVEEERLKAEQEYREFLATPVGQARAAYERGDHVFQYSLDVMNQRPIIFTLGTCQWLLRLCRARCSQQQGSADQWRDDRHSG
jgi:hypothetical protein